MRKPHKRHEMHGDTRKAGAYRAPEYITWVGMLQRCYNPLAHRYDVYGARGITVCKRWRDSYIAFRQDMGRKPSSKHSIDRVDGDGNYEPHNCRWATSKQQGTNRRGVYRLTVGAGILCATEAAERIGVTCGTVISRIKRGWSVEDAATRPPEVHKISAISARGEVHSFSAWSRISGVPAMTIRARLSRGETAEQAIFGKPEKSGRKISIIFTIGGETLPLTEWVARSGLNRTTVEARLAKGWSFERALFTPLARVLK